MKSLFPIILIVVAGGLFFFEVSPLYSDVQALRAESTQYDQALKIADQLASIRAELSSKLKSFSQDDLDRLNHFLPHNLDTVRIILDVNGIADNDGLKLKNLGVVGGPDKSGSATAVALSATKSPYETVDVSFAFTAPYAQGVHFIQDVERSLRLLDTVGFKIKPTANSTTLYDFSMTLHVYWLNR